MSPGIWQILLVVVIALLLFGRGKISAVLADIGQGIKSFKKGLSEDTSFSSEDGETRQKGRLSRTNDE